MHNPEPSSWTPRYPWAWATLAYVLGTIVLAYPALGGGFLVTPVSDQFIGGYPVREFAAQYMREHHGFPLWSPYLFGGMPYVAAMHGDIFYPTFLLRLALGTDVGMTWSFIIHVFLCGMMTFGFLRVSGFSFTASIVAGLAYMMSGNIAGLVSPGHDGKLYLSALLPLTLWLLVLGMRQGKTWVWGVLGLVVGLAVLSPHPQLLQYLLLVSGAFALYLGFGPWIGDPALARPVAFRRLGMGIVAVLIGFAIGAIQYAPVMEYVAWSPRASGVAGGYETAVSYSYPPEEIINAYLPQFSGILTSYWGRNGIHLHSDYLGATVLLLAVAAVGARKLKAGKSYLWFWYGTLAVSLLWALGGHTPFYRLIYAIVPGTRFFRAPSTMLFVVTFSVCVLVAIGVDRLISRELTRRYLMGWAIAALAIALLATAGFFTGLGTAVEPRTSVFIRANAGAVTLGAIRSLVFILLAAGVLYAWLMERISVKALTIGLGLVVGADLWSVVRLYWNFSPPAAQIYASDATIEYVKKNPARVWTLPLADPYTRDPFLKGDGLMVHGVRQAGGYHGNHLANYEMLSAGTQNFTNQRFWELGNVKYVLTDTTAVAAYGFPLVAGPVKNAFGTTVYLYELPGDNPQAWVTTAIYKAGDEAVLSTLYNERFDPRGVALFDSLAPVTQADLKVVPPPSPVKASVRTYEPGHIVIELDQPAPAGSALVVSENYYPGWKATVGGQPAAIGRADVSLIGVELPAQAREVELTFSSAPYDRGKAITIAGLVLGVLLAGMGAAVGRRARGV